MEWRLRIPEEDNWFLVDEEDGRSSNRLFSKRPISRNGQVLTDYIMLSIIVYSLAAKRSF